jgi:hypothetical protein
MKFKPDQNNFTYNFANIHLKLIEGIEVFVGILSTLSFWVLNLSLTTWMNSIQWDGMRWRRQRISESEKFSSVFKSANGNCIECWSWPYFNFFIFHFALERFIFCHFTRQHEPPQVVLFFFSTPHSPALQQR